MEHVISNTAVPSRPQVTNLNSLLQDIYVRYVALKEEEFRRHYKVFTEIFQELQDKMKEADKYYERYASDVKYAGSHYDNLRIKKPDEFDMIIVIDVPVNMDVDPLGMPSDIEIRPQFPGYVQLRGGVQYQNLPIRDGVDGQVYMTPYNWMDKKNFILSSKFISWFKGVGAKGLNKFKKIDSKPVYTVDGVVYTIGTTEAGPAWTIQIEAPGFHLDVDLVPALKFPESRWLKGKRIRPIPAKCRKGYWIVVAKPNKEGKTKQDTERSWRIGMQDQEREFLNNTYALRQTMRLVKQLRDAQDLHKLTSYYIKNIFFCEIAALGKKHPSFWEHQDIATLFKHMVTKLDNALNDRKIPYFWNRRQNFIKNSNYVTISEYRSKIASLRLILAIPSRYREVAQFLLSGSEYDEYQKLLKQVK